MAGSVGNAASRVIPMPRTQGCETVFDRLKACDVRIRFCFARARAADPAAGVSEAHGLAEPLPGLGHAARAMHTALAQRGMRHHDRTEGITRQHRLVHRRFAVEHAAEAAQDGALSAPAFAGIRGGGNDAARGGPPGAGGIVGPEVLFASTLFSGPLGFAKPRSNNSIKILEVLNQNLSSLAASSLKSKHFYFKILLARLASEVRGRCLRLLHIEWRLGPSPGTLPQY